MIKLAVIFESSPFDRKGLFNAVHNRILNLLATGECEIDAYCIHSWDTAFTRKVRKTPYIAEKPQQVVIDGIVYNMLWYDFSIIDHITVEKLCKEPLLFGRFIRRSLPLFRGYDAVLAHSLAGALMAEQVLHKYALPYFVTWHGSDIHTHSWRNRLIMDATRRIMKGATCNFFVSKTLEKESDKIVSGVQKEVLYNGVSEDFVRFSDERRRAARIAYGLSEDEKVVAFVGSLSAVKNVDLLQPLFREIRRSYKGSLKFWVVGDGKRRQAIEPGLINEPDMEVCMMGNRTTEEMPSIMNCIDVLVLPSRNEGLGMVCAEAIRCGANAAGADVGGIAEVVGKENVVPHGPDFIEGMASKVTAMLTGCVQQSCPEYLDWKATARKEMDYIRTSLIP